MDDVFESTTMRRSTTAAACSLTFGETEGLRHAMLRNGLVAAEVLLDKGANVRQVWHVPSGARVLAQTSDWREQLARYRAAGEQCTSYCDCYEGGWQDVLPARARWEGGSIGGDSPGVGEAAIVPWEVTRAIATPASAHVICRARLPRSGLEVTKRFQVRRGRGALRVQTEISNPSLREVSFSWTQHPALGGDLLDGSSHALLPVGRPRVSRTENGQHREVERAAGNDCALPQKWLRIQTLLPDQDSPDRFVTFSDVASGTATLVSRSRAAGVRLRWDLARFPHLWLWCARRQQIACVAVEPSNTYLPEMIDGQSEIMHVLRPGNSIGAWVELSAFTTHEKAAAR